MSNFIKVCPVRAELLLADEQTDGQTDKKNLTIAFRNFANPPNKLNLSPYATDPFIWH